MRVKIFLFLLGLCALLPIRAMDSYEQKELLDRGMEIMDTGLDLYGVSNGLNLQNIEKLTQTADKAGEYLKQLRKAPILETDQGAYFKQRYLNFINYLSVAKKFNECLKEDEERRVSLTLLKNLEGDVQKVELSCQKIKTEGNPSFDQFYANIMEAMNEGSAVNAQKEIIDQSLSNYAKTFANLTYSLKGEEDLSPKKMTNEICQNQCDSSEKELIEKLMANEIKELTDEGATRYRDNDLRSQLDQKVDHLNQTIDDLNKEVKTRERTLWWDAMDKGENFDPKYDHYLATYMKEVNEGPGLLLMTKKMKESIGAPRLNEDYEKNKEDRYSFPKHNKASLKEIKEAKGEVFANLKKQFVQMKERQKRTHDEGHDQDEMEELIISNPIAASQILQKNPVYANHLCGPLANIGKGERFDQTADKVFLIGGAVLGVGLMATGIGSLVGGWLLAGTAAASTLATVGTVAGVSGFALGAVEGGYWSKRMIEHKHDLKVFETSILAGSSNEDSYEKAAASIKGFKEARFDAILSFGFSALESVAVVTEVGRLNRALKGSGRSDELSATEKTQAMNKVTKTLKTISENESFSRLIQKMKDILGAEKFSHFLAGLSQLSQKARVDLLTRMSKIAPEKYGSLFNEAMADAINQSLKSGNLTSKEAGDLINQLNKERVTQIKFDGQSVTPQAPTGAMDLTSALKEVETYPLSAKDKLDIELDKDFKFYLTQIPEEEQDFFYRYIKMMKDQKRPKEKIIDDLHVNVGQCRL